MGHEQPRESDVGTGQAAYLQMRDGNAWRDMFRLAPNQVTTIGRAPTNRIVIRDEICSRNHCEVFLNGEHWTLRDLGSRNGTLVNGHRVVGDLDLDEGDVIRIGKCQLSFTYDVARPSHNPDEEQKLNSPTDTEMDIVTTDGPSQQASIVQRARHTRFHAADTPPDKDYAGEEVRRLYRLALEMGTARDCKSLCDIVLKGLLEATSADIGAILLLPPRITTPTPDRLQVVAYRLRGNQVYERVSDTLSSVALREQEGLLANVHDDHRLSNRDSLGELKARSVICAPIRCQGITHGLVHLYSSNPDNPLDGNDLDFTLAVADHLALALENLQERESLQKDVARVEDENESLRRQLQNDDRLVGDSPSIQKLRQTILRVAPANATVLIRGESGVGKELVARAIHRGSDRKEGPFVCMNCAALSESLLESELFGHEKGSFTGAIGRKLGKFEQAHRGTLFLDEVGEMSLSIQAKFLRVLEGHQFERVGGGTAVLVDVRVVAATNRDLEKAVAESTFRRDLYFRLHVLEIMVDPLKRRKSDIPLIANYFLDRFARKTGRPPRRLTRDALDALLAYDWPGNVRELQNVVERAGILCADTEWINESDIQLSRLSQSEAPEEEKPDYRELTLDLLEQKHILATLDRTNWNKSRAAQILGIERSTLDRKLKRYDIDRPREAT